MEAGLDRNFERIGKLLASLPIPLFAAADCGLILPEASRIRRITSAKELAPLLIDHVRISVTKNGKYHSERPSDSILNNMLASHSFLQNFKRVEHVVTTTAALSDHRPSSPGYNLGGIFHLGASVATSKGLVHIDKFLNVMDWQSNADRTNAVAALLTVPYRHHFPGAKPLILVTANKSHAGKGTVIEFIRGNTSKAELLYENIDWPMQRSLQDQLHLHPEIGVINIDNVRTDSSGRAKLIRSGFLESFITNAEIVLSSATSKTPLFTPNRFVVLLNTNEGALSIDLLNRSLPIRLTPTGDLTERIARSSIGDPKHDYLPKQRCQIEAEMWGMIDRWIKEGKPLDKLVRHPMGVWAKTIGGILRVNGFTDFLANYSATRVAADPIREAISILAFHANSEAMRARDLAKLIVSQGLAKTLLAGVEPNNEPACERAVGHRLKGYVGETFMVTTPTETISYRLLKQNRRWEEEHPHFRYTFEEITRCPATEEALNGLVLEPEQDDADAPAPATPMGFRQHKPEVI
jgi:hypothetical protein